MNHIVEEDLHKLTSLRLPWEELFSKTILVTGASGFIASYVVKTLLYLNKYKNAKIKVIALVRNHNIAETKFSDFSGDKRLSFLSHDMAAPLPAIGNVDYVIHAASFATPSKYGMDPVGTLLPNILGTYHLLEFGRTQKLKGFLFVSSGEVYGNPQPGMEKIPEDYFGLVNPSSVRSCYAESKRMGETMCVSWHAQYGIPTKIVRLFHTYGPGMSLGDGRVHSDFVGDVIHGRDIVMKSDGYATRPFCYIADTAFGFFTILLKGVSGEVYNLGSSTSVSISELANILVSLDSKRKLRVIKKIVDRGKAYLVSPITKQSPNLEKIMRLGWREHYTIRSGFKRTIESYIIS